MAEENISEVKEVENGFDTNPPAISEERVPVVDVGNAEDVKSVVSKGQEEINEVPKPPRRHSTGVIGTKAGKPQVQSRYRGNYQGSSIHESCKHGIGKKCDQDDAVKPWKMARKKSVEGSEAVRVETPDSRRKSLSSVSGPVTKPDSSVAATVKKKPSASVTLESSSVSETAKSVDGSSVKSNDKALSSGSAVVKKVSAVKKVSKTIDAESAKVCAPKNLKEKAKTQAASSCEDVKEKTVRVVESSIRRSSEKKTMGSGNKSSTGLPKKKESVSADPKPEKKIRPKRTGVKVNLTTQLSFKRGKIIEPKSEDSSPRWAKFRKRVMQEQKKKTQGRKKTLKSVVETKSGSVEGSKREKVVLRHRKVEGKKKMMTLFNNVIEETMHKLTKVRKTNVKALIGAFETVISLQDTKTPQKAPSKATPSASNKVSPLVSKQ